MTRLARISAALALLLPAPSTSIAAQQATLVATGQRVRVVTATGERLTGELRLITADTLVLTVPVGGRVRPTRRTLPTARVRELYVSQGGRPRSEGAVIGLLVGAVTGAVVGAALPTGEPGRGFGAAVFGVLGGLVGLAVGAVSGGERWERVR